MSEIPDAEPSGRPRFSSAAIRKARDLAVLIPVFWIILIMPPVVTLFTDRVDLFGIPLLLLYLLVVWLGGIAATAWNARRLASADEPEPIPRPEEAPPLRESGP